MMGVLTQKSHSLLNKLTVLESLLKRANDGGRIDDLNLLLQQLEEIVTCGHCHEYFQQTEQGELQAQIERVQGEACRSFTLLEKNLNDHNPGATSVDRYLNQVSKAALQEAKFLGLNHRSRLLFIGCGSRPTSCHALSVYFGCQVVGIDNDPECIESARDFRETLAQSSRLSFEQADGDTVCSQGFSHVIIASLVKQKADVLSNLALQGDPGLRVAARFGKGLQLLMNFPLPAISKEVWSDVEFDSRHREIYQTAYLSRAQR